MFQDNGQELTNEALKCGAKVIGLDQSQKEMEMVAKLYNWKKKYFASKN